jgi:hypothetical protein
MLTPASQGEIDREWAEGQCDNSQRHVERAHTKEHGHKDTQTRKWQIRPKAEHTDLILGGRVINLRNK